MNRPETLTLTTSEAVARVTGQKAPVLRNLLITQSYHELSWAIADVLGALNVNWATFACWASKTAGISIRSEELPRRLEKELGLSERTLAEVSGLLGRVLSAFGAGRLLASVVRETLRDLAEQIAVGNQKVYAELAPLFAQFVQAMGDPDSAAALGALQARLAPGATEAGGQQLLVEAFAAWAEARTETEPQRRAQVILRANCLIGLHEQTRLQPHIAGGMDAPIDVLIHRRLRARLGRLFGPPLAWLLSSLSRPLVERLTQAWRELATRYAMNLSLPGGKEIPLGRDLPERPATFPRDLEPVVEPKTAELLRRFDPNLASQVGSGARNWANLNDRMGFIVELFRSRQQDASLLGPPFSPEQTRGILRGEVPPGAL